MRVCVGLAELPCLAGNRENRAPFKGRCIERARAILHPRARRASGTGGHWGRGAPHGRRELPSATGSLWGAARGAARGGCSAELGLSADSSDSTRNQRGIGRIGLSVREPFCFRDWTVCQWIRIESKVRQIATRGKLPGFRAVTGVSLGKGLFSRGTRGN